MGCQGGHPVRRLHVARRNLAAAPIAIGKASPETYWRTACKLDCL
jgi:hypothetical protein